jgi:hypothetical protein
MGVLLGWGREFSAARLGICEGFDGSKKDAVVQRWRGLNIHFTGILARDCRRRLFANLQSNANCDSQQNWLRRPVKQLTKQPCNHTNGASLDNAGGQSMSII